MNPFLTPGQQDRLVLASRSPRRIEILRGLGFEFEIDPAPEHLEEDDAHDDPYEVAQMLAVRKCEHVSHARASARVLAADTIVIIDGGVLQKPRDDAEARSFVSRLSGRTHTVVTAIAICDGGRTRAGAERTLVTFRSLSPDDIARYVATGEGRDKAGSYAAQGIGAGLIRRIEGCFFNVVGLPVALLLDLMQQG
ncbi:MAG TPA: Maf family protein [Candidatus Krumholzibacteria bacterium]|nr:Maf family protein [Candidatus Krumholzibacteria bacterium]